VLQMIEIGDESLQSRDGHEALTAYFGEVWRRATTPPATELTEDEAQGLFRSLFHPAHDRHPRRRHERPT
jgi:hypothetical protein